MYDINFWSILVAAVVSFGIGALWYSPVLFGKEWMALKKISEADISEARTRGMWGSYVLHFIATLISFSILGFIIAATNAQTASDSAFLGFLAWLGFAAPIAVANLLWDQQPFKLVLINTIQILVGLVIGGAIIGAWR